MPRIEDFTVGLKYRIFQAALNGLAAVGAGRWTLPGSRGLGGILMLHHVRPWTERPFAPNRLLEVTPEFLDAALARAKALGFRIASLDAVVDALEAGIEFAAKPPLLAITFDDGYRDNLDHALPVLRRHGAPAAVFVTPGFADRSAGLWWCDLEDAIARADEVRADLPDGPFAMATGDPAAKAAAFEALYWRLRALPEPDMRTVVAKLAAGQGIDSLATTERLCLDWAGLRRLAADPLITIGAHTMTHPMLAKHDAATACAEMADSRAAIERELGVPVRHLAYPVGDPTSAGPREFAMARELGFRSAVTTRPGMLFPQHRDHLTALPRVSLNGNFQNVGQFGALLSGIPFHLWNKGRRLNVA
ncbi:polysaccharide deacetylase family protein [Alsobacter metallidurans]|uniref:polysaccharide deacetylase family protein n=1 Tax=Alsobacter metallidurans TaxID=340221 RepID=UPI001FCF0A7A|nr:polysaccharide deacetylase family protein [Alsobacter metallidurans]